jgi:hypothetical protein
LSIIDFFLITVFKFEQFTQGLDEKKLPMPPPYYLIARDITLLKIITAKIAMTKNAMPAPHQVRGKLRRESRHFI